MTEFLKFTCSPMSNARAGLRDPEGTCMFALPVHFTPIMWLFQMVFIFQATRDCGWVFEGCERWRARKGQHTLCCSSLDVLQLFRPCLPDLLTWYLLGTSGRVRKHAGVWPAVSCAGDTVGGFLCQRSPGRRRRRERGAGCPIRELKSGLGFDILRFQLCWGARWSWELLTGKL